jgi:septum site-determining protein MinD
MGEVIAITSGKDGVGKTVVATNLGISLVRAGHSVILLDMNVGLRNLDIQMGIEDKIIYDVADILTGICPIKKAIIKDDRFEGLYLVSAPQNADKAKITNEHTHALYNELKQVFDYVIIDAPAGTNKGFKAAVLPADRVILVTVPEYASVRDTELLNMYLKKIGTFKKSIIINKIVPGLKLDEVIPTPEEIEELLGLSVSGLILFDQNIHISSNSGLPISASDGNYISDNFRKIVERVVARS